MEYVCKGTTASGLRRGFSALLVAVTLMFVLGSGLAHAQLTTANVSGTVTDPSGAAVPGAEITVKNTETGITRNTVSGGNGRYEVVNLPVGSYEVSAQATGFQTSVRTGVTLTVGQNAVIDHALQVGNVAEQVTVTGEVSLLETTTATVSQLVDAQKVEDLPLNNRDLTQLAVLQPGVIKSPAGRGTFGGLGDKITVGGARGTQNLYLMDGVSNSDLSGNPQGASGSYTGAETVKEFQVVTNNYSAEYQSAAGAIVSAVTKSGTNQIHGSGFWTLRNDNLDAARWEENAFGEKGEFKRNQFGGSFGGPIVQDRTFYFASYEGTRERSERVQTANTLSNQARASVTNATLRSYLGLWPVAGEGNTVLPNERPATNDGNTIVIAGGLTEPVNDDTVTGKFDHNFSSGKAGFMSASYSWNDGDRSPCGIYCDVTENGATGGNGTISKKHTLALNHTSVLTPTVINEFKFGYSFSESAGDIRIGTRDTKSLAFHPNRERVGQIVLTPMPESVGYRVDGSTYTQKALQFKEGLSFSKGNHSFRVGSEIKRFRYKQDACSRGCNGIVTFRNFAEFFTNTVDDFQVFRPGAESPTRNLRQLLFGAYLQDNWQVLPSLTFNLGMRYEFVTVPDEDNHLISTLQDLVRDNFVAVTEQVAAQYTNEPRAFKATNLQEFFRNPTLKSFSPRFGFAWAPGDKKTSIRGGYGIFYDYPVLYQLRTSLQELPPFVETARLRARAGAATCRVPISAAPNMVTTLSSVINSRDCATFNLRYMEPNQENAYIHRWSMTLQRELAPGTVVSAGYTGSRGLHLLGQHLSNLNKWDDFPTQPTGRKHWSAGATLINPAFGEIRTQSSNANSYFHGLAVGFQTRMTQGLQMQVAYNYSKSIDQGSGVTSGGDELPDGQRGIYYWDMHLKKQLSGFDIRNTFSMNFSYDLPTQNLTGLAGAIAGGWQLTGILTLTDGHPITVSDENNTDQEARIGESENLRVNLIEGGNTNPVLGGPDRYFDVDQFLPSSCQANRYCYDRRVTINERGEEVVTYVPNVALGYELGYFGNLGGGTLTSPGIATLDFSLVKNFAISESQKIQFRADFFNMFNRPNFAEPQTQIFANGAPAADAGRITETENSSRQIQLGLRYTF